MVSQARLPEPGQVVTGAEAVVWSLVAEGVEVVFGYPGGAILPTYDALFRIGEPRHVLVRHEQGAAHMAEGYARASGKVGVCVATSGPGATNLVTGLASAYMDSVPVVAITGQVPTALIGRDAFQESDVCGITMPITKHNYLVRDAGDIPRVIHEAFHLARSGRPGPVLVDLPKDVANASLRWAPYPPPLDLPGYRPTLDGHPRQIEQAARLIEEASRPVLYVGGGVIASGAQAQVQELAERAHLPVVMTLMGLGALPGRHPLSLGMLGMHGAAYANYAVSQADLLIAVGARFDDRVTGDVKRFAAKARKIHIDVDPAEIGKNVPVDVPIVGDARRVLQELVRLVAPGRRDAWWEQIRAWQESFPLVYERRAPYIAPQDVVVQLDALTAGEAVVVTDVGQHQMWVAQFYRFQAPRLNVTSGGLGAMGFGLPAAIGARLAVSDRPVVAVLGDGGLLMTVQELATAADLGLPLPIVVLNNYALGMVKQWQGIFYQGRFSHSLLPARTDLVAVARGFGVPGRRVERPEELTEALAQALAAPGPYLLDVQVDPDAQVMPMVPPGGAIDEMIGVKGRQA
ncbi:biosynthetic-type acetolactate synthase large subunit [Geochorda subterranea]|uniref:Acetolactate synthase n=1 Tax=Geochorda subterranea TaxID=3109564 RepID=A0ABZ1BRK1_9FIRM|nr:biosynthetic-type acetolactate synthase large subunit [Limnochorda sp. LNt]WRP15364.1 biosynthetic-type acetolactate synthase large subunit [Limnochorda sp. LNt]